MVLDDADLATLNAVSSVGPLGATPTLTFEMPLTVTGMVSRMDVEGTGATLKIGQIVMVNYAQVDGDTGEVAGSSWDTGQTQSVTLGDPDASGNPVDSALVDQKVGVRVLLAIPGSPAAEATDTTAATDASPAKVMVIEVVSARDVPARAEGTAVAPVPGLPTVTLAEDGSPSIDIPADEAEPTTLVVQPLITGTGAAIAAGQTVVMHYSGWLWDGTKFDSSWEKGAPMTSPIGAGQIIPGWDEGLIGQTVGSQVLLLVPPDKAYGAEGNGTIPPNSSLIFVVDILDAS